MAINTLNGLPVELKICILQQMPDLPSIRSLVLASSQYYQTYSQARSHILFTLLCCRYNGEVEMAEALVAMRSEGVIAENTDNRDKIMDLLDLRRGGGCKPKNKKRRYKHDAFSIDEIVRLLKLHDGATYFLEDFVSTLPQPPWWQTAGGMRGKWHVRLLSPTERARFFRAFYRLQTWCYIFGQPEVLSSSSVLSEVDRPSENDWTDKTFSLEQAWRLIWGTMPPWEVEEIGCLLEYFMSKYVHVFQEISMALAREYNDKADHAQASLRPGSGDGSRTPLSLETPIQEIYELRGDPWSLAITFRYSMIEIGPYFLYKLLCQPSDQRQTAVANNLRSVFTTKLWEVTGLHDEFKLPLISPADKYERDNIGQLITSWPPLDQPNHAWIRRWGQGKPLHPDLWMGGNEIGNFNAYPTAWRQDWKWAYVLWDDERLAEWKVPM